MQFFIDNNIDEFLEKNFSVPVDDKYLRKYGSHILDKTSSLEGGPGEGTIVLDGAA